MKDERISLIIKSIIWGFLWLGLASVLGLIITNTTTYKSFENVIFIEGLILIFVGLFTSISGDSLGLSLQGLGQSNAQYIANANLEVTKRNKEKSGSKMDISFVPSTFSILIGGILSVALTFII